MKKGAKNTLISATKHAPEILMYNDVTVKRDTKEREVSVIKTIEKKLGKTKRMTEPRSGQNVLPMQSCPAFIARAGALESDRECWFCAYADFHIDKIKTLEVGICGYPTINSKLKLKSIDSELIEEDDDFFKLDA